MVNIIMMSLFPCTVVVIYSFPEVLQSRVAFITLFIRSIYPGLLPCFFVFLNQGGKVIDEVWMIKDVHGPEAWDAKKMRN